MKPSFQIPAFSWLALNFLGYYCAFGVIQPFFPLWLQSHHYSEFFIAFVMSSAYLFRFLGGLLLSKRVQRLDALLPTIRLATWGSVAALLAAAVGAGSDGLLVAKADWLGLWTSAFVWLGGVYFGDVAGGLGGGAVGRGVVGVFDGGVVAVAWSDAAAAGGACVA